MRVTNRDIEILNFINRFGFCEMPHLNRKFGLNKPYNYELMKRLQQGGLVRHKMIYHMKHGAYWLSVDGASFTNLPPLKKIPMGIYNHEVTLIDLYFKLVELYPDAIWVSERELIWDKFRDGVGKKGHISDGLLIFPDGKKIAIELELSLKGQRRTERIFKQYGTRFDVDEVWYFCHSSVMPALREIAASKSYIKLYAVTEYVHARA